MTIDRARPPRPPGRADGAQRWRRLLFLHWPVPVAALRPLVPAALELDLVDGVAYVGVVPFAMLDVRPRWLPRFAAFDFLETNVRTYVRAGATPGVFFFSLEAESRLAVLAARASFGLPYHHARMRLDEADGVTDYETRRTGGRRPRLHVRYRAGAPAAPSEPATLQHFLVERYHLFVERGGRLQRGQVFHEPYPVASAEVLAVEDELVAAAGLPPPGAAPAPLACYSPGVDVEVFGLRPA
jgi:uncharacterized protein YqjF (DUF2071 family)